MIQISKLFLCLGLLVTNFPDAQNLLVEEVLGNASVTFSGEVLTVSTGQVQRIWKLTPAGFQTVSFINTRSGKEWAVQDPVYSSDWNLPKRIENETKGTLRSITCIVSNDEKFTADHLSMEAVFEYEKAGLRIKYLVRVYPDSPGIWTALEVKSAGEFSLEGIPEDLAYYTSYGSNQPLKIARNEFIPVDFSQANQRRYWGLYNDPGNRVNTKDMVEEKVIRGYPVFQDEENAWASGMVVESGKEGLVLVKESNKTVNKYGHQTGCFYATPAGLEVTGWGLKPSEITSEYRRTWATWSILYSGGEDEMELALKKFDRFRYPVNLDTDMHILIDTWGSDWQNDNYDRIYGRENSAFPIVEKEIKSASDLGIDVVRIDDGWQEGGTLSKNSWHPNTNIGYSAHWEKTKALSLEFGVKMGLWAAVRFITSEELLNNQKELDVATWKFDFDKLEDWESFDSRMTGIRQFIKDSEYRTQVSWCPEYDDQRYGWYSRSREYGPMYFQNIQNNLPHHIVYVPYITLRHHWMMSRFYNMNDLQCHWQNPSRTNPEFSDAHLHSQSYAAMSAFMGAPSCFMLTQLLKPDERDELRELIRVYKENREEIFESFVFPIGDEPNNASWTGFQIAHPDNTSGYLMIFRELHNQDSAAVLKLKFLIGKRIKVHDLEREDLEPAIAEDGLLNLHIDRPASYRFLKYEVQN